MLKIYFPLRESCACLLNVYIMEFKQKRERQRECVYVCMCVCVCVCVCVSEGDVYVSNFKKEKNFAVLLFLLV